MGPTAVGKTEVAIHLAEKLQTEIVSADSRQCYAGMAVGTAAPTAEERERVPHYFVAEYPVTDEINAADYERIALAHLAAIFEKSDYAVVCGGTGLYIKALLEGLDEMPATSADVEQSVNDKYAQEGLLWLQAEVKRLDPQFFEAGEIHNPARLLRALSFMLSTGESILTYRTRSSKERPFSAKTIGLDLPRDLLYERINQRVDKMMEAGLLEEVKTLLPFKHLKNLQTVGYAELFAYLEGKLSYTEAVEKIKQHTRNYAKRQLTWFRKYGNVQWFDARSEKLIDEILMYVRT